MEEEKIRELFANLISKSVDSRYKDSVLPVFSGIIKQLSTLDARVLETISDNGNKNQMAMFSIYIQNKNVVTKLYINTLTPIDYANIVRVGASIDNLIHCGLIKQSQINNTPDDEYEKIKANPFVKDFIKDIEKDDFKSDGDEIVLSPKQVEMTNLGCLFYDICCKDSN